MEKQVLLKVRGLKKYFRVGGLRRAGMLKAVDGVDFDVSAGETLGVVGESGCGKTTLARTIIRLYRPTAGEIVYRGRDISRVPEAELRWMRKEVQMIFQDPFASLNPRMTVNDIISEPLVLSGYGRERCKEKVQELLKMVGLNPEHASRYPHEFSGGQRQRIGIARALAMNPSMIIADEPVSALDVSIQAQIVNLLQNLQEKIGLTYVVIAHDLSMVKHISDRVMVMYLGKVVEIARSDEIYSNPLHPYTQALMSAVPIPDPEVESQRQRLMLNGEVPSPIDPPPGCRLWPRCKRASKRCAEGEPRLCDAGGGHMVACHLLN